MGKFSPYMTAPHMLTETFIVVMPSTRFVSFFFLFSWSIFADSPGVPIGNDIILDCKAFP